ncbi:histidine phosphatase family protein [Paenibacillus koleovorans]|uniref:histidine phosphatase family protein n=1 Tax=Paenibacillus koleovorans TaxID=121608 RepID=UPI000FD992B0|nr:histidine phosphatase family protein [Paenibacillus koleovorans]
MRTNLIFVRHAHSIYTPESELTRPLSERGKVDAGKVAKLLQNAEIDTVIASPYLRALQTVEGVAKQLDKEVLIEEEFRERTLSENPVDDFNYAITKVWEEPEFAWEGGESNRCAQERGVRVTLQVLERSNGKTVVIGTHGNLMALIMGYFDPKYDFHFWKQLEMPDMYQLSFDGMELVEVVRLWE